MIYLLIPICLYALSNVADAIMDTLIHHFSISIFSNLNKSYWNPYLSWYNKYNGLDSSKGLKQIDLGLFKINKPVILTDAWHLFKTIKELLTVLAIASMLLLNLELTYDKIAYFLLTLIAVRALIFNLFYNKILLRY